MPCAVQICSKWWFQKSQTLIFCTLWSWLTLISDLWQTFLTTSIEFKNYAIERKMLMHAWMYVPVCILRHFHSKLYLYTLTHKNNNQIYIFLNTSLKSEMIGYFNIPKVRPSMFLVSYMVNVTCNLCPNSHIFL